MNKKGFTLAEILGVIVIISLLLLLLMPTIINKVAENSDKASEVSDSLLKETINNYIDENLNNKNPGTYCIPVQELVDSGQLVSPVIDVQTGEDITDKTLKVTIDNNHNITYEITEKDQCEAEADSTIYQIDFVINPNNNKWVHERSVIIKYPKLGSAYTYEYKIDDGPWQSAIEGNYSLPSFKKISSLEARVTGDISINNSIDIINIDNEIPVIKSLSVGPNSKIQIKAIDNVSGIAGYYISENSEKPKEDQDGWIKINNNAKEQANIEIPKGEGTYYVWVKDKAGNISSEEDGNSGKEIILKNKIVTATFTKGSNITSIDSASKSCTILAGNNSCQITLPNIVPISEYVIDGWYKDNTKVGNAKEKYNITEDVTLNSKAKEDVIKINLSNTTTTNSVTVIASASALSDIVKYEFSKDGGRTWQTDEGKNIYTFTNMTHKTTYTIQVRVSAESGKKEIAKTNATTKTLTVPTYTERGTKPKIATIHYPTGCGSTLTCTYQKDNGQVQTVNKSSQDVTFNDDGTIVAWVSDGTNKVSSSYTVTLVINATYHSGYYYCPSGYTSSGSGSSMKCTKREYTSKEPVTSYTCPSGYKKFSTTRCMRTDSVLVRGTNTCDGNGAVIDNTTNQDKYIAQGYTCTYHGCTGSCDGKPNGSTIPCSATCRKTFYTDAIKETNYLCPIGYTSSGSRCVKTTTKNASYSPPYYTCPSGYSLSGSLCYPY